MKQLPKTSAGLMLMSALVFAPTFSNAQIIDSESEGTLNANVKLEASSETEASSTAINAETDSAVDATSSSDTTSTTSETDTNASLKLNANGVAVITATQVNSDSDLEIFRSNISAKEEMVEDVQIHSKNDGSSEIVVTYKHYGKLFGVMPVVVKSQTTVETEADGKVEVESDLPWWSFMVTEKNYVEAELESKLKANPKIKASADVELTAEAKAEVVEAVVAELNTHSVTNASITQ